MADRSDPKERPGLQAVSGEDGRDEEHPPDAISDAGLEGGVDEPNEGTEPLDEPERDEPESPGA